MYTHGDKQKCQGSKDWSNISSVDDKLVRSTVLVNRLTITYRLASLKHWSNHVQPF